MPESRRYRRAYVECSQGCCRDYYIFDTLSRKQAYHGSRSNRDTSVDQLNRGMLFFHDFVWEVGWPDGMTIED